MECSTAAHAGRRKKLEADRQGFRVDVEGVQIHHPLEAALGELCQQP